MPLIKVDLHVHSSASFDCSVEPAEVAVRCAQIGLAPIFLTDHDTIDGALAIRDAHPEVVIGEEVMTSDGELIGLFLTEGIPAGLPAIEVVRRIKAQGGLVYLEHPYDSFRRRLSEEAIDQVGDRIDIVEIWNGRSDRQVNEKALQLCEMLGAAPGAGSDAHKAAEIGSVFVEMESFAGATDFLDKLRRGKIVRRRSKLRFP